MKQRVLVCFFYFVQNFQQPETETEKNNTRNWPGKENAQSGRRMMRKYGGEWKTRKHTFFKERSFYECDMLDGTGAQPGGATPGPRSGAGATSRPILNLLIK